jgi:hypothetical protein
MNGEVDAKFYSYFGNPAIFCVEKEYHSPGKCNARDAKVKGTAIGRLQVSLWDIIVQIDRLLLQKRTLTHF